MCCVVYHQPLWAKIVFNVLNINLMLLVVGFCDCDAGYTGDDCRVNMKAPPDIVSEPSDTSLCSSTASSCKYASVFGENFYESANLRCLVETAEVNNNKLLIAIFYVERIMLSFHIKIVDISLYGFRSDAKQHQRTYSFQLMVEIMFIYIM